LSPCSQKRGRGEDETRERRRGGEERKRITRRNDWNGI
jgi:hypothetical protein